MTTANSSGPAQLSEARAIDERAPMQQPELLFFLSPTCGISRRVDGFLAQVLQRRANHSTFRLLRIDVERHPDLAERFEVTDLPTLLVISDGRIRGRVTKPTRSSQISSLLSPWLK